MSNYPCIPASLTRWGLQVVAEYVAIPRFELFFFASILPDCHNNTFVNLRTLSESDDSSYILVFPTGKSAYMYTLSLQEKNVRQPPNAARSAGWFEDVFQSLYQSVLAVFKSGESLQLLVQHACGATLTAGAVRRRRNSRERQRDRHTHIQRERERGGGER